MPRLLEIKTPLADDLTLVGFHGREALSTIGGFEVSLKSKRSDIGVDRMLGQNVTLELQTLEGRPARCFNGYVTRWSGVVAIRDLQEGPEDTRAFLYTATVSPWLWFLTRSANSRIFQNSTVPQIVDKVLLPYKGLAVIDATGLANHRAWPYCVQYRETDFNFISRLLEQEGIYYYFKHEDGKHTLMLVDKNVDNASPLYDTLSFADDGQDGPEMVERWHSTHEIQPGRYATKDYNYETPKTGIQDAAHQQVAHPHGTFEFFDFPGEVDNGGEATVAAQVRIDELHSQHHVCSGGGALSGLSPGCTFTLQGHPVKAFNEKHLVVATTYRASNGADGSGTGSASPIDCDFTTIPFAQQFRPARVTPKPLIQGPQTAVVVGKGEIETDDLGRVKVQFHWNRPGQGDQQSSCFLRVAQVWAGKGWGGMSVPRVGQEVVVAFLEGDPDSPIVVGRVYNPGQTPPYMDKKGYVSGVKSQTVEGSGYNELSFDDTKDQEKVSLHAEHDMSTVVLHDQDCQVKNNRTDKVDVDDALTVGGNRTVSVTGDQKTDVTGKRTTAVTGDEQLSVTGKRSTTVTQTEELTVMSSITQSATSDFSLSSTTDLKLSVGGSTIELKPTQITLSFGASSITIDAMGISLTAPKISLNG